MNRTLTTPDSVASRSYNERSFSMSLSCLESPAPPDRGDISGQLTSFSTTKTALRAVKETEECDESHVDLTRQCDKSAVTMSAVSNVFILPGGTHAAGSR
jgi:hypothetical protein